MKFLKYLFNKKALPNGIIFEKMFRWEEENTESKCFLRLFHRQGRFIALAQELQRLFGGTRFLGLSDNLPDQVFRMCREKFGLKSPDKFQLIEYHPKGINGYDKDTFFLDALTWWEGRFLRPDEKEFKTFEEIKEIIGQDPPRSLLRNNLHEFSDEEREAILCMVEDALKEPLLPAELEPLRNADATEFWLAEQTTGGLYVILHHGKCISFRISAAGELFIPSKNQVFD